MLSSARRVIASPSSCSRMAPRPGGWYRAPGGLTDRERLRRRPSASAARANTSGPSATSSAIGGACGSDRRGQLLRARARTHGQLVGLGRAERVGGQQLLRPRAAPSPPGAASPVPGGRTSPSANVQAVCPRAEQAPVRRRAGPPVAAASPAACPPRRRARLAHSLHRGHRLLPPARTTTAGRPPSGRPAHRPGRNPGHAGRFTRAQDRRSVRGRQPAPRPGRGPHLGGQRGRPDVERLDPCDDAVLAGVSSNPTSRRARAAARQPHRRRGAERADVHGHRADPTCSTRCSCSFPPNADATYSCRSSDAPGVRRCPAADVLAVDAAQVHRDAGTAPTSCSRQGLQPADGDAPPGVSSSSPTRSVPAATCR